MASFILKKLRKKVTPPSERTEDQVDYLRQESLISYDTSLPGLHVYLGNDLQELSGRTVLDEDSCQTIPIISLPGVVLMPGQILPLQLFNTATISMMIQIINNDRTFGLVNSRFSGRMFSNTLETVGTTVEIRSYREVERIYGGNFLRIKAEGRQRFKVLETKTQSDGIISAKVQILPELITTDPGECSKLSSLNKFRNPPPNLNSKKETNEYQCHQLVHRSAHKYNKFDFTNYTWFPEFVYKLYDPHILMKRIKEALKYWNRTDEKQDFMPCDPKEFSYWIAANLPLNDKQRLDLLKLNEVTERLRLELQILDECSALTCRDCMNIIAYREDIFSMSLQGPQGTYVNPNGYVHEAITVYKASKLRTVGRPSTEASWFPGYAWTIVECERCSCHMGWRFTAVDKKVKPVKFWALCRSSIQNTIAGASHPTDVYV
ncbi:hypothetical protein JTE90_022272 [Oedothorax gibbosus]|uniref:Protein cereblon n=1 Tax=Oedothorax gibbosus TaxID=931172 RepID=A0AAV6VVN4_9ARAC|nr:hypothetical protein JTE90_022272 [Oedothorax gibbosus]